MEEQQSFEAPQVIAEHEQEAAVAVTAEQPRFKTLGVRLEEGLHAQLSFIAQLTGNTLADEIRSAIEGRVTAAQNDQELVAKADTVRREIEREAAARREAIAGFFGSVSVEHVSDEAAEQPATSPRATTGEPATADAPRRKRPAVGPRSSAE